MKTLRAGIAGGLRCGCVSGRRSPWNDSFLRSLRRWPEAPAIPRTRNRQATASAVAVRSLEEYAPVPSRRGNGYPFRVDSGASWGYG